MSVSITSELEGWQRVRNGLIWVLWLLGTAIAAGYLFSALSNANREIFLPGQTTYGHYQIQLQCAACHDEGNNMVRQDACLQCHAQELERVGDSHPIAKFAKSKDALHLGPLDMRADSQLVKSRYCITCHVEHRPEGLAGLKGGMGLTQPENYCKACHSDIQDNRATHEGLTFKTCLTAGCHNFHDNSGLFEQLLKDHIADKPNKPQEEAQVPLRDFGKRYHAEMLDQGKTLTQLTKAMADAPSDVSLDAKQLTLWQDTAHAKANVNCTDCHNVKDEVTGNILWKDNPGYVSCQNCHDEEVHGFLGSRHGMRLEQGLSPMTPAMARLPMLKSAANIQMTCNTCHSAHSFDTTFAAMDACMQCHADEHTLNFKESAHHDAWLDEQAGVLPAGSGVSCATCHLPRVATKVGGKTKVTVMHNQNDFLRPNEKMVRPVCLQCHGMPLALDALADEELIKKNFNAQPSAPHFEPSSFDLIKQKLEQEKKEKKQN